MISNNQTNHSENIEFSTRLIYELLGNEIIESNSIAIAEQVKNAKDANASDVLIDLSNIKNDEIIIKDNGDGMSYEEIRQNWLMVGTNNKNDESSFLGGKGVGRFSLFRIADNIRIETIKNNIKYTFNLNKNELETDLNNNSITIFSEDLTEGESGTKIVLNSIDTYFNLEEIETELENLNDPQLQKIHRIKFPDDYNKVDFFDPTNMISKAPFVVEATIKGNDIDYNFKCIDSSEILYENNEIQDKFSKDLETNLQNLSSVDIGIINVKLYNFYFDNSVKKWKSINENQIKKKFLNAYQGISIYRNGYKIYGHGKEDWLKIAELRVSRASDNIDNKQTYGYIILDNKESANLKEKTNREGFIRSLELTYLKEIMICIVKQMGQDRKEAAKVLRNYIISERKKDEYDEQPKEPFDNTDKQIPNEDNDTKRPADNENFNNTNQNKPTEKDDDNTKKDDDKIPNDKTNTKRGKSHLNKNTIIDKSFECPIEAPEKIKLIVDELKYITNDRVNAQALLLRCLIDVSTQYFQLNNSLEHNDNLPGNIKGSSNYMFQHKMIDQKHYRRVNEALKKQKTTTFFNGVAHEYNFRPNFTDIKDIWNIFEKYIYVCNTKNYR